MSDVGKISVLNSLLKLRFRDEEILNMACKDVTMGRLSQVQSLTNLLYVLAKFKYLPDLSPTKPNENKFDVKESLFMQKCTDILKKELVLPLPLVCRNLWNFYAL